MSKPIAPDEVNVEETFPDWVFTLFNEIIKKNWSGEQAKIYFSQVRPIFQAHAKALGEEFKPFYMDVEIPYRAAGWDVHVDSPGYNESYEGFYIFRKRKNK